MKESMNLLQGEEGVRVRWVERELHVGRAPAHSLVEDHAARENDPGQNDEGIEGLLGC